MLLTGPSYQGQYSFKERISQAFADKPVYLSLVEHYKKSSGIYLDQSNPRGSSFKAQKCNFAL